MSSSSHQKPVTVEELQKLKTRADADDADADTIMGCLDEMLKLKVTMPLLQATRASAVVKKLRRHADARVSAAARALMAAWKEVVVAAAAGKDGKGAACKESADSEGPATPSKPAADEGDKDDDDEPPLSPGIDRPTVIARPEDTHRAAIFDKFVEYISTVPKDGPASPKAAETGEYNIPATEIAGHIEDSLFEKFGGTNREYMSKFRSLASSLRSNAVLRNALKSGSVAPHKLVDLPPEELATEELRQKIEAARKADFDIAQQNVLRKKNVRRSKMFRCGKCGKRETTFFQLQTRSADEPMTTFVTCLHCGNQWKFC